jgi:hypothetical protein
MGAQVFDGSVADAVLDLSKGAGLWVYPDRDGVWTVDDAPTVGGDTDWLIDASATGVQTSLDREKSRERTYNVVTVTSSNADGESFTPWTVWDNDPSSPTYAGTDPVTFPGLVSPFGVVPYLYSTALPLSSWEAYNTAVSILHRVIGLASQVSMGSVPNPAIDAGDTVSVLPPKERYDIARVLEQHIADTVTNPLVLDSGSEQHIDGRSSRADDFS